MRRKGIFTILAAVFMVLAFSAMAFAANQVNLKTTVPNIPKSTCYQAGTDTMEFDDGSRMEEGDVITITLNNKVTICKEINMFVTFANTAGVLDVTGVQPVSAATAGAPTITAAAAGQQWGFVVKGPVGSQVITLTLRQVITATGVLAPIVPGSMVTFTGAAPTDKFLVKLFDGKVGVWAASGIQKWSALNTYATVALATDNVLCIDTLTQDYLGEYVQNTPNSVPVAVAQHLNFTGDYVIAHIMVAQTYNLVTCKGATCGNIVLGAGGQAASCVAFDYESNGTGLNGYCTNHKADPGYLPKFIIQTSQDFDITGTIPYVVTAEILVNGVAGAHGVYWSNVAPAYQNSAATTCGLGAAAIPLPGIVYTNAGGGAAVPVAPIAANCAGVAAAAKAVKFVSTAAPLFVAGDLFFELNLPPFNYNLAEVNAGDVVTVRVTLAKATCGSVSLDLCIGTFGCVSGPVGPGAARLCPYVTSLAGGENFWNGIAVVNTSAAAGTVTLTAVKSDGSANATYTTPSVAAGGMFVSLVSDIPWTGTTPAGVPAFIQVQGATTITAIDAFVMMADDASNSMGYLCR